MNLYRNYPAYIAINPVIMLVMSPVERKVRLPGNTGSK